jgi:hypothetical protein
VETGFSLFMLSFVLFGQGDLSSARVLAEEGENINRSIGNRRNLAYSLMALAFVEMGEGNVANAGSLLKKTLTYFAKLGDSWAYIQTLTAFVILAGTAWQPQYAIRLGGAVAALYDNSDVIDQSAKTAQNPTYAMDGR